MFLLLMASCFLLSRPMSIFPSSSDSPRRSSRASSSSESSDSDKISCPICSKNPFLNSKVGLSREREPLTALPESMRIGVWLSRWSLKYSATFRRSLPLHLYSKRGHELAPNNKPSHRTKLEVYFNTAIPIIRNDLSGTNCGCWIKKSW